MDYATILAYAVGVLTGLVAGLKLIAPRTKNTYDDKVLAVLEKILPLLPKTDSKTDSKTAASTRIPKNPPIDYHPDTTD